MLEQHDRLLVEKWGNLDVWITLFGDLDFFFCFVDIVADFASGSIAR